MPIKYREAADAAACCADCGGALAELAGHRGLRKLGRAHRTGELAGLADLDTGTILPSRAAVDAEIEAFDGRLNAWLLDYASAAASLPSAFVQQVDDFAARWRALRASWYLVVSTRAAAVLSLEAEFNRLRDQFLGYGKSTAIAPATVTANGSTVRADQIPPGSDWLSKIATAAKWGGVIVLAGVAYKVSTDLGLFKRIGRVAGGAI